MSASAAVGDSSPYSGVEKLVIAFDIGTYSTAVSVAHLEPGVVPKSRTVGAWPSSEKELKIRSAAYYDKDLNPKAYAAEVYDDFIQIQAKEEGWHLVEFFKLLLHPSTMSATISSPSNSTNSNAEPVARLSLPSLPAGLDIVAVYTDFTSYLWLHTQSWYEENIPNGRGVWNKLAPQAAIVFATPDGWTDQQQAAIRTAFRQAGIMSPNDPDGSNSRLQFIHESEASVHWCLSNSNLSWLNVGTAFTILDAGGSTVDSSLYVVEAITPQLKLRNVKASDCVQTGGVFMTLEGRALISEQLHRGTRFRSQDYVDDLTSEFETKAKRKFGGGESKVMLKLGGMADEEPASGVLKGKLILDGKEVEARCFADVAEQIVACARRQTRCGDIKSKHVLLVGGVGESPYIKSKLRAAFADEGIEVVTGDEPTKKAVAEGAIIWFVKGLVVARAVRATFGAICLREWKRWEPEHRLREPIYQADNTISVNGCFDLLIEKDTVVTPAHFVSRPFHRTYRHPPTKMDLSTFQIELFAYHGDGPAGEWVKDPYGSLIPGFASVGTVFADLSPLLGSFRPTKRGDGLVFYHVDFDVGVGFGSQSLHAKILWKDVKKLVIAFDIGTYSTAVSVAHLEPGVVPKSRTVSAWPSSEKELKVRSAAYYDEDLNPKAFAAEVYDEFIEVQAKEEGWHLIEFFKLLLHPSTMSATISSPSNSNNANAEPVARLSLPSLPARLDIIAVYTDFIHYLYNNTQQWYEENIPNGRSVWNKLAPQAAIVFATPDGWTDQQQAGIRAAFRQAGILSHNDSEGSNSRLQFIHESEASVHWCLSNSNLSWLNAGTAFTILDAGGSTVDSSLYVVEAITPHLKLRNVKASDCVQTGGVFMTLEGRALISEQLRRGTRFRSQDYIDDLTSEFETKAKRKFGGGESKVMLKLGGMADEEPASGVLKGKLILDGKEVEARCFADVAEQIVACARRQTRCGDIKSKHVLLVGGVGESPYIKSKLRAAFADEGIEVVTGDEPTKKAVAEGAIIWFVKSVVVARAVRNTIGAGGVWPRIEILKVDIYNLDY
ncbi:hypothetical protein RQP46_001191 [Phenoliferia psychrophenolica]